MRRSNLKQHNVHPPCTCSDCVDTYRTSAREEIREILDIWYHEGFLPSTGHSHTKPITKAKADRARYEATIVFLLKSNQYRDALQQLTQHWPYCNASREALEQLACHADTELQ